MQFKLRITSPSGSKTVTVENEISVGRTSLADVQLDDSGLSRVNTTFFIDDGELLVTDENSTNGTFINGDRISGPPRILKTGDQLTLGSYTKIEVLGESDSLKASAPTAFPVNTPANALPSSASAAINNVSAKADPKQGDERTPLILIAASAMVVLIIILAGVGIWFASGEDPSVSGGRSPIQNIDPRAKIPVHVIDPLGGENENELDDLIASWEVAEEELKEGDVADVNVNFADDEEAELNVTAAFLADRQRKALESRPGLNGIRPAGLDVPPELRGDGVIKQKRKLLEMKNEGYRQPLDFAELAQKRLNRELIEMPMATNSYYLDVGGSASNGPFESFSFQQGSAELLVGSEKHGVLARLANDFAGQRYDLNNPADRKQMRMRLLRMFNQRAKPILQELADHYFKEFGRPLRVTSLTRSMDYQRLLTLGNANAFKVRDENALPPHTSGCAFDLARKHMPVQEQNFLMKKLADMEREGRLDALIEYGVNACFHIFIYDDGKPPA